MSSTLVRERVIVESPPELPSPVAAPPPQASIFGSRLAWIRDFAIIGFVSGFGAPAAVMFQSTGDRWFCFVAGLVGMVLGGVLGGGLPLLLDSGRRRMKIRWLLALGPVIGAVWGASTMLLAMAAFRVTMSYALVFAVPAGIAGAVQFGTCWFPYTFQAVRGGARWPVLIGAALLAPVVGWVGLLATILTIGR